MSDPLVETVKWYTSARKFPRLIGRMYSGERIWGGPYTLPQVIAAVAVVVVGWQTMPLWARYGLLGNAFVLLVAVGVVVFLVGRLPPGARNPLWVLLGVARAVAAPRSGRLAGRPVRLRRPHRLRHRTVLLLPPPPGDPLPASRAGRVSTRRAAPVAAAGVPLSAVSARLAARSGS